MLSLEDLEPGTRFYLGPDGLCYVVIEDESRAEAWLSPDGVVVVGDVPGGDRPDHRPMVRVDVGEREPIDIDDAIARLTDGSRVHVVTNPTPGVFTGAMWDRAEVVEFFRLNGAEVAGPKATAHGYGVASTDGRRWLFFATKGTGD